MPETIVQRDGFRAVAARLRELGVRRVLIITGASRRFVDEALDAFADFEPAVFDGARVHVPAEVVERATAALTAASADAIVAIDGGSAIGVGKALRLDHDVKFVAVPTTYAGSEMTTMYGITRAADKQTGRDPRVAPDLVLYDATLLRDLPIALTAQSLLNAFAHVASALSTQTAPRVITSILEDDAGSVPGSGAPGTIPPPAADTSAVPRAAPASQPPPASTPAATTDAAPASPPALPTAASPTAIALGAARDVLRALEDLLLHPRALVAREHAAAAAAECARAFEAGKAGVQHALAHLLGGALALDHAALHAALLPQFLAHLRATQPTLLEALEVAVDRKDLDAYVHDLLVRAGAPVALTTLKANLDGVKAALATKPDLPGKLALDALVGLRPPGRGGRTVLGGAEALVLGAAPATARRIILALHGRGAEAGTIARRFREIVGHDPETCVIGLRADGGADRWYAVRYNEATAGTDLEVTAAIDAVHAARTALAELAPAAKLVVAGFSQGACLALEYAARHGAGLAAVLAPCGARIGQPDDWEPGTLAELPVLIGAAAHDKWIVPADLDATAAWYVAAGARVDRIGGPGDVHEITPRQRLRARELVLGARAAQPAGAHESGIVPPRQNSPRVPPNGLYAEQLNGTPFTAPRAANRRSWLYRVRPSAQRRMFAPLAHARLTGAFTGAPLIELAGFAPLALPDDGDFVDGLVTLCGAGDARLRRGYAFHRYACARSMNHRAFYSADGDLLILPELGALTLLTELGSLAVAPGALAIVPRGTVFSVLLRGDHARGYVAEPFGRSFELPERGPIGANGLADPRHFRAPHAWCEDRLAPGFRIVGKLGGHLHEAQQDHSPFDVAGWHGNHVPLVYNLADFSPVGNTAFDHGDPSIYTVISAPLDEAGVHTLDLVVFPPRWDASEHTFRPPFFHRNAVAEINGIVREPHASAAFSPGCAFITPPFTGHGVSGRAVERERARTTDAPVAPGDSLWFQLESALAPSLPAWVEPLADWPATWGSHRSYFE